MIWIKLIALAWSSLLIGSALADQEHAVILLYHHVSEETPTSTSVTPNQFAAHLEFIDQHGYEVLDLTTMLQDLAAGKPVAKNAVAITFDDGYVSVLQHAAPMLAQRDWPFTVFVSTAQVGQGALFLDWQELEKIGRLGGTVANHGLLHGHMAAPQKGESQREWRRRVKNEISQAQAELTDRLGYAPKMFAYPYGEYSHALQSVVRDLGLSGLAQHSGAVGWQSDFTALPRHPFHTDAASLDRLAERLRTMPLDVRSDPASGVLTSDQELVVELDIAEGAYHLDRLACFLRGEALPIPPNERQFTLTLPDLDEGRNTWICTAPAEAGGYAWWSHLILRHVP